MLIVLIFIPVQLFPDSMKKKGTNTENIKNPMNSYEKMDMLLFSNQQIRGKGPMENYKED